MNQWSILMNHSCAEMNEFDLDEVPGSDFVELPEVGDCAEQRSYLEVDLDAIGYNVRHLTNLGGQAAVMAVVKGNAYGLGARIVATYLEKCGVRGFAVDNTAEGIELRHAGISSPILVLDGCVAGNAAIAIAANLTPGIPDEELLASYDKAAADRGLVHEIWLVANVGFNRAGPRNELVFRNFVHAAKRCENLEVCGLYAHLTNSHLWDAVNEEQIHEYSARLSIAEAIMGRRLKSSLFASHGILAKPELDTDWIRPGVALYGVVLPTAATCLAQVAANLRPAISLRCRVLRTLEFESSQPIGYGQTYRVRAGTKLATLSFGFGSGYPECRGRSSAIIRGHRVPVAGDVGMDAMQVDVTGLDVRAGDWATLLGSDGQETISVESLSANAATTPYQLLTSLRCSLQYRLANTNP